MYEQPQQPGYGAPGTTAIAVTTKYWWMTFIFGLITPYVAIDGHQVRVSGWGRTEVPVPPGQHNVHVHVPYFLPSRIGNAETVVTVHPGQTLELEYAAPAIGWLDGTIGAGPQQHNGKTASIILLVVPLVLLLLCVCGGIGLSALDSGSSTSLPPIVGPAD